MSFSSSQTPEIPVRRPTIVAGIGTSLSGSLGKALAHAEQHQFFAIDLDQRRALLAPSVASVATQAQTRVVRVRSIWIPGSITGPFVEQRTSGLWHFLEYAAEQMGLRTVILPRSSEIARGTFLGGELRKRMQLAAHGSVRLAIGVRGSVVYRGHDQLAQLQTLRHSAEEWDLDIALDLAGNVPHYLEAEAAVLRLLPKLTLVRIPSWVSPSGELNTDDPISRRVVSILADQGYTGTISIIPARSPLQLPGTRTYPTLSDEWTRQLILDQYDRQLTGDRPAPYISPELFREQY
ncbi:MAG: hypothetical protein M3457_04065 [Chloroflexota bacterium]|nr:hypothetical protein [Chloroflexota bacterium]